MMHLNTFLSSVVNLLPFLFVIVMAGSLNTTSVLPFGSWDSHVHVIDDRFPLDPNREYTPKPATKYDLASFESERGIAHPVIVLPSVYGTDNAVLIDALKFYKGQARGVAVVDPDQVTNATLTELREVGVRGLRVNFGNDGTNEEIVAAVVKTAAIAKRFDWVVQVWIPLRAFVALHPKVPTLGVRMVADHFVHAEVGSKTGKPLDTIDPYQIEGFPEAMDLVRRRLLFVKISAPYQDSKKAPLYDDMRVVAETIMLNGPEMVVYGSDWPHTASKEGNAAAGGRLVPQDYRQIDDAALTLETIRWAGSAQQVQRLFVDNPRRLWQWDKECE